MWKGKANLSKKAGFVIDRLKIVIMDVNKSRIRLKILFTSRFPSLLVSNQNLKSITVVADLSFGKGFIFPL